MSEVPAKILSVLLLLAGCAGLLVSLSSFAGHPPLYVVDLVQMLRQAGVGENAPAIVMLGIFLTSLVAIVVGPIMWVKSTARVKRDFAD